MLNGNPEMRYPCGALGTGYASGWGHNDRTGNTTIKEALLDVETCIETPSH